MATERADQLSGQARVLLDEINRGQKQWGQLRRGRKLFPSGGPFARNSEAKPEAVTHDLSEPEPVSTTRAARMASLQNRR